MQPIFSVPDDYKNVNVNGNATNLTKAFYKGYRVLIISFIETDKTNILKGKRVKIC